MKRKGIEFNAEELVGSVEAFAAYMQGKHNDGACLKFARIATPPDDILSRISKSPKR